MLSSNADISLAGIEFQIDQSVDTPYDFIIQKLQAQKADIAGLPGAQSLDNELLWWMKTDWAGGEGNAQYYPDNGDDIVFNYAGAINPRNRGYFMGRPDRVRATVTPTDNADRPYLVVGAGVGWLLGSREGWTTVNGTSFTALSTARMGTDGGGQFDGSSNFRVTAACGDLDGVYFSMYHTGSSGSRGLRKISWTGGSVGSGAIVQAVSTGAAPYAGLTMMDGRLYAWTGRRLRKIDVFNSYPLGGDDDEVVYDTKVDPPNTNVFTTQWWADCLTAENSVIMFYSANAMSTVYEYKADNSTGVRAARPLWRSPYGFTIKSMTYQNGKLYLWGHWSGDSNIDGWGAGYRFDINTRQITFLKFFRSETAENLQMQESAGSYGSQVLVGAANTGRIFVYDSEFNAISLLDDMTRTSGSDPDSLTFTDNDDRIGALLTYGQKRIAAVYQPDSGGADYQILTYKTDHKDDRETGFNTTDYTGLEPFVEEGAWDFGYPMERKVLHGIFVSFLPLISGQHIRVDYSIDGANWVTVDTLDFAETGADLGRKYFPVSTSSSTIKFYELRYRVYVTSDTAVVSPIVKATGVAAECSRKIKRWNLTIRVKDEMDQTRAFSREWNGDQIRDRLRAICDTQQVVAFIDGFRYKQPNSTSTHSVMIRQIDDVISEPGEGSMRVLLEEVPA